MTSEPDIAELKAKLEIAIDIAAGYGANFYNDVMCIHSPELPRKPRDQLIAENRKHVEQMIIWEIQRRREQ